MALRKNQQTQVQEIIQYAIDWSIDPPLPDQVRTTKRSTVMAAIAGIVTAVGVKRLLTRD